jgi:hypothetical protein
MSTARRAALADVVQVAARSIGPDVAASHRPRIAIAIGFGAAVAAAIAIVMARGASESAPQQPVSSAPPVVRTITPLPVAPEPTKPTVIELEGARYTIEPSGAIRLREGGVLIEAATPTEVKLDATTIKLAAGRAEIHARRGVIASVHVFAGSAQIVRTGSSTTVIVGETWEPQPTQPTQPPHAPPREPVVSGAEWFRRGWLALREHREADAIAAFDRATEPSIAEDAAFWAAIAAERAGDSKAALARFERFLVEHPRSDRASAATEHLRDLRTATGN